MQQLPWYETVNGEDIQQGDILRQYPIFLPNITPELLQRAIAGENPEATTDITLYDVVVLTQTCDLAYQELDTVILCPVWSLMDVEKELGGNVKEIRNRKEAIRQGKEPALHLLAEDSVKQMPLSLVEFKRIYTSPKKVLTAFAASAGGRLRIQPPYREHLSQAFARYFMRVGLPLDIPSFK